MKSFFHNRLGCLLVLVMLCIKATIAEDSIRKPVLAILASNSNSSSENNAHYMLGLVTNYIVNSNKFNVIEQNSLSQYSGTVLNDNASINTGKNLRADKVLDCTIINISGQFFLELRLIDVATSTIEKNKTANCQNEEELAYMIKKTVERLCGVEISSETGSPLLSVPSQLNVLSEDTEKYFYNLSIHNPRQNWYRWIL